MEQPRFRASLLASGVLMPVDRGRIPAGTWLYAACRPLGVAAHIVNGLAVALHPRLMPGRAATWVPPSEAVWAAIVDALVAAGLAHHAHVVLTPTDPRRQRFNLLVLDAEGHHLAFVKAVRRPLDRHVVDVLDRVAGADTSFWCPTPIAAEEVGDWSFMATTTMPPGPHGPARLDASTRRALIEEVQAAMPPPGDPSLAPVHGDFGPWNVRRLLGRGRIAIVDWEEATLGPGAADAVWHAVTDGLIRGADAETLGRRAAREIGPGAAQGAAFWVERLSRDEPTEVDAGIDRPRDVRRFEADIKRALAVIARG